MSPKFSTLLVDPPWPLRLTGKRRRAKALDLPTALPYPTMSVFELCRMPVEELAAPGCHLYLWTTNQFLEAGFEVMRAWGFTYLAPIHWVKPTGLGNYWIHRTQTILFGYYRTCKFPLGRYRPNVLFTGDPRRHSQKPDEAYELIEAVSPGPRLELFARLLRPGWAAWGNEVGNNSEVWGPKRILEEGVTDLARTGA